MDLKRAVVMIQFDKGLNGCSPWIRSPALKKLDNYRIIIYK